jgi:hypothetical protein
MSAIASTGEVSKPLTESWLALVPRRPGMSVLALDMVSRYDSPTSAILRWSWSM